MLYARASELEAAFSFGIVRQLFEAAVATAAKEEQSTLLGGAAAQAARLFGTGASRAGSEEDVYALLHGLYWLTVNLAESRPLALAVDDVQWADPPSLRWLAYLARRLEGVPVCALATLRPVEDEHPVLTELLADPATVIVRPNALGAASVAELVRQELGADAEESFCLACHHATGGNPLLLSRAAADARGRRRRSRRGVGAGRRAARSGRGHPLGTAPAGAPAGGGGAARAGGRRARRSGRS